MVSNDPVVRYTAAGILLIVFAGCVVLVIHGYWLDEHYQIPNLVNYVLASGVSTALTLLGVHFGRQSSEAGVSVGAQVSREAVANGVAAAQKGS